MNNERIHDLLNENKNSIAREIVEKQYSLNPKFWSKFGEEGRIKSQKDAAHHISFLAEAILLEDSEVFTDYIEWLKLLFKEINLPKESITETLNITKEILENYFTPHERENIETYISAAINHVEKPVKQVPSYIDTNAPLGELAKEFNETLIKGRKNQASNLILKAVEEGVSIQDIYLNVFQKSQLETGRLWLMNKISVAKEHYVSAATQMIMSQLYPYIFSTERKGLTFIGACVGGELHEIGLRMVSDFFEMDGWDTYYLGANTPVTTIISAIQEYKADILGLSIAMPYHQSLVKKNIEEIRKEITESQTKILVGGNGINTRRNIWKMLGADNYAPDARSAINLANKMIQQ
ncbi:MAG: B12-binding domain-containing protein [Bacteroidales bacterium]